LINKSDGIGTLVNNLGTIGTLHLSNIFLQGKEPDQKVQLMQNKGTIQSVSKINVKE
jgi:hypothetical protein